MAGTRRTRKLPSGLPSPKRKWFRDRRTATAAAATVGLLAAIEAADITNASSTDDDVRDQGTGALFAAAMAPAIIGSGITLMRRRPIPGRPTAFWTGVGLIWTGVAINRTARHQLGPNYRARLTLVSQHRVVSAGLYRYLRHPMYAGSTLICTGVAVTIAAPASLVWALPVLSLIHRIRIEEALLQDRIGAEYTNFTRSRARIVPMIW